MAKTVQKFSIGMISDLWSNIDKIKEILRVASIVVKHLKNLIEDLTDDGKLNGSNLEKE